MVDYHVTTSQRMANYYVSTRQSTARSRVPQEEALHKPQGTQMGRQVDPGTQDKAPVYNTRSLAERREGRSSFLE